MKLSDAIRIGAQKRPQAYNALFSMNGSCALGAALDAWGFRELPHQLSTLAHIYPELSLKRYIHCEVCGNPSPNLQNAIIHLNDDHKWSREKIADWVESNDFMKIDTDWNMSNECNQISIDIWNKTESACFLLKQEEKDLIQKTLEKTHRSRYMAAQFPGITNKILWRKMNQHTLVH